MVDAIRDALVRRRRSNNDTSSAHRRMEPEMRDDRPKDFPPSHTPGGTSARRVFTGVRDLLEDLRAAVDDAELMEQQRGGPDAVFSSLDLELDAGCRAQAGSTCALVWSALDAFHDPYQHEDQFLAHGGVDVLLCVMRTFPLDANVVAAAAGACLSLARDCPAGRRVLERCGGRRALRAAMCVHPGVNFGGAFGGLSAWLDGSEGGGGGGEAGVGDAEAEAAIVKATGSPRAGGESPGGESPGTVADSFDGLGVVHEEAGNASEGETVNEFDEWGGIWASFRAARGRLSRMTRALKVRRLTFQPVLERTHGHLHPCALWAQIFDASPSLRYFIGGGPRSEAAEKKSGKTLELRELVEVSRGVTTTSLLSHAPDGGAARCLALRFSSKTVNLVFSNTKEREWFAKSLGIAAAHVSALIGRNGVNVAARRQCAVDVMGMRTKDLDGDGPDALPAGLCAAEFELDKALARGECKHLRPWCSPRCSGRFCVQQVDEVRRASAVRWWTHQHDYMSRRMRVEERKVRVFAAVLERLRISREEERRGDDGFGGDLIESISGRATPTGRNSGRTKNDKTDKELDAERQLETAVRCSRDLAVKSEEARREIPFNGFAHALRYSIKYSTPRLTRVAPAPSVHDSSRSVDGVTREDDSLRDPHAHAGVSRDTFTREDASVLVRGALGDRDSAMAAMKEIETLIEGTGDDAVSARHHLAAEGAVQACASRIRTARCSDDHGRPESQDERLSTLATQCLAYLFRDLKNARAFLRERSSALKPLADHLESLASFAERHRVQLETDAETKAAEAAADGATEIVKGEDQASARRRYRKNRLAVAAADKAHELASAPVVPPRGTHELASALANLCAGSSGDAVAARDWLARRGGVVAALKLICELCANGGAPAPQPRAVSEDDETQRESTAEDAHTLDLGGDRRKRSAAAPETRDALKPVLVLLRSLSTSPAAFERRRGGDGLGFLGFPVDGDRDGDGDGPGADSGADSGPPDAEATRALSDAFRAACSVRGVSRKTTVSLMWTCANLALAGGESGQRSMNDADAPRWIARVCAKMSAAEASAAGERQSPESKAEAEAEAEVARAALAATTNLCAGNHALNRDVFREELGAASTAAFVETIRMVVEEEGEREEGGSGDAHKVLKNAADSVGSALDKSQTRAFNRVKARVNEREMESRVGAWARLEGRMHVARHL